MCNVKTCVYSFNRPWSEQLLEGGKWSAIHLGLAMTAGAIYLFVRNARDLLPGIIVGTTVSLSIDITHKLSHLCIGEGKKGYKKFAPLFDILFAGIAIYYLTPLFLKKCCYALRAREIAPLVGVSLISIAVINTWQKE